VTELKTKVNNASVVKFINSITDEKKKNLSFKILDLMKKITKEEPKMWGSSIVGFGHYHYKYESGREGDWFLIGFSPRKQNFVIYLMSGVSKYEDLLKKLGKYKTGKGCLYINKEDDIDINVLTEIIKKSTDYFKEKNS